MTAFASLFSVDIVGGLIGGLGLFLLAMKLMTDGLKLAGGDALKDLLARWTSTPMRGLLSGMLITALVQSSSAVTVATIGFVNAGLMSLFQAIGVVFGTNIGTTMTAWLVAALGFKVKVEAFALPMIGVGVGFWFLKPGTRRGAIGQALAGFGLFFVGIDTLRTSFESIAPAVNLQVVSDFGALGVAIMVGVGFLLTLLTQSSSAAIAITLTAASGGVIALPSAAAMVIGSNVGTTSTAFLAALGATPNAKRVATAHVIFNGVTGGVALVILPVILFMISRTSAILGLEETPAVALALFHTVFNILGVALMWPFTRKLSHWLAARFRTAEETESKPQYIDKAVATTPELGLNALLLEAGRIGGFAREATAAALTRAPGRGQAVHAKIEAVNALDLAVAEFATNFGKSGLHETVSNPLSQVLRVSQYGNDGVNPAFADNAGHREGPGFARGNAILRRRRHGMASSPDS